MPSSSSFPAQRKKINMKHSPKKHLHCPPIPPSLQALSSWRDTTGKPHIFTRFLINTPYNSPKC